MLVAAGGCSRTVALSDPVPTGPAVKICRSLMAALPDRVLDQERRSVTPGVYGAAWGDPTITLRCGVPKPDGLGDSSECLEVNGVGWFDAGASGGAVFTTTGRPAYVQVSVPDAYAPEPNALVDLAAVITTHDPVSRPCQ